MDESTDRTADNPKDTELSVKLAGTILVSEIESELSTNDIHIYFQKTKNSGGEVLGVSMRTDRREALVYFEEHKVAEAVMEHQEQHVIKLCPVKVRHHKKKKTVLVSNLPEGATKETITTHFENVKNGGGEIGNLQILKDGKALVIFKNEEVADKVVNTKQTLTRDKQNEIEQEMRKKKERTVVVSGLTEGVTENSVHIYFQKKKNNGGEVEKTILLPGGNEAWVIFEDPIVAENVVKKEHNINGKQVHVKRFEKEAQPSVAPRGEIEETNPLAGGKKATVTFDNPEDKVVKTKQTLTRDKPNEIEQEVRKKKERTVVVSGLPEGVTENRVRIYFQKKKNEGGEVEKTILLPGGKAWVIFEDPKVAENVVKKEHNINGKEVHVKRFEKEAQPSVAPSTILVSGLPSGTTKDKVTIHFQKRGNGGGEIKETNLLAGGKEATVTFDDPEVAKRAASRRQVIQGTTVAVTLLENEKKPEKTPPEGGTNPGMKTRPELKTTPDEMKEPGSTEEIGRTSDTNSAYTFVRPSTDQVFSIVSATVNIELLKTASRQYWNKIFSVIQKSCGVQYQQSVYGYSVMLTGSLSQVTKAGEILELKWKKHRQDSLTRHVDVHNVSSQSGTNVNQAGTNANQFGTNNESGNQDNNQHPHIDIPGNPQSQFPGPSCIPGSSNPTVMDRAQTSGGTPELCSAQPPTPADTTINPEPGNYQNGTATDSTKEAEDRTTNVNGIPERDNANLNAKPPSSETGPTISSHQPPGNNEVRTTPNSEPTPEEPTSLTESTKTPENDQQGTNTNPTSGAENLTTTNNEVGSATNDKTGLLPDQPSSSPDRNTTCQPLDNDLQGTTTNPSSGAEHSTTSYKEVGSTANDKTELHPEKQKTSPDCTTTSQPPDNDNQGTNTPPSSRTENLTTTNKEVGSATNDKTGLLPDQPSSSPDRNTTSQPLDNHQQGTTTNPSSGAEHSTTSYKEAGSTANDKTELHPEKQKTFPDCTTTSQPPDNDNQGTNTPPSSGTENLITTNKEVGSATNGKTGLLPERQKTFPDRNTTSQPLENDPKATTLNTTTVLQNPTTSNNHVEIPLSNTQDTITEKPVLSNPEETPNNQPEHNQQQTVHDQVSNQQTSTPENVKNSEISTPNHSPSTKPSVTPRSPTENNTDTKNNSQKRTPVPLPRQNKPGGGERRQIASKFSTPLVKQIQTNQGSPSPTELKNNNSGIDQSTVATKPNEENDHDTTAQNSTKMITTDPGTTGDIGYHDNNLKNGTNTSNIDAQNALNDKTKQAALTKSVSNGEVDHHDHLDDLD